MLVDTLIVLDSNKNIIDIMSNNGDNPSAPYFDDKYIQILDTGAETYELSTFANSRTSNSLQAGNFVLFMYDGKYKMFQIIDTDDYHEDGKKILSCYCEMAGLELLTDYCEPFTIEGNIITFMNTVLQDTNWSLGRYSASLENNIQIVKNTKNEKVYTLIQNNLATFGGVEIEFRVEFVSNTLVGLYIDCYANGERGNRAYNRFEYGENIKGISRNRNIEKLATASIGEGKNGLDFKEIEWSKSKGDPADKPLGQNFIVDLEANDKFNKHGKYIKDVHSTEDETPQDLLLHTWEHLQEVKEPQFDYNVDLALNSYENMKIGDTNYVVDFDYNPPILLEARIGKLELSFSDETSNKCTLSNYKELTSILYTNNIDESLVNDIINGHFPIGGDDIIQGAIGEGHINTTYYEAIKTDIIQASVADVQYLIADKADIEELRALNAILENVQINKADIVDLIAKNITFNTASGGIMNLQTLISQFVTGNNGQFLNITADNVVIANAVIRDIIAKNMSLEDLKASKISTNKFNIVSDDGGIEIVGATQQFKDKNNMVRLQIGQDTQGNFNFILIGEDGVTTLIDHTGIKENAIADDLIKENMVAADAIGEKQINYSSFIAGFNKDTNTNTIKSTKIMLDNQNQSLDVAFNALKTQSDTNKSSTESNATAIKIEQGKINTLISDTTITEDGESKKIKDVYNTLKQTVNGTVETIASLETEIGKANTNVNATVKAVKPQYYLSDSTEITTGGIWQDDSPAWINGKYMWQRLHYTYVNGNTSTGIATCIAGAKGDTGAQGIQGIQGVQGIQGITGTAGINGKTTYFHIKYSTVANPTTSSQMTETPSTYIGTYVDYTEADSTDPAKYTWARFEGLQGTKGEQGIPGTNGEDGLTTYLHIKYSNDGGKTFTANNGETVGDYIGTLTDYNSADSLVVNSYTWAKIKGEQGIQGVAGATGANGVTYYTWIKYADSSTGSGLSDSPIGKSYIGLAYNKTTATESTTASDYTWSLIKGEKGDTGVQGATGANGITYYTWIKYSDSITGNPCYDTPTSSTQYIGIAINKTTSTESSDYTQYTWSQFKGNTGATGQTGQSVTNVTPQFYAHTSNTSAPASTVTWLDVCPSYVAGKYLWIRNKVTLTNPVTTKYTDAYYDASWDAKNIADNANKTVTSKVAEFTKTVEGFSQTVGSVKTDLANNYSTTSDMNTAIEQSSYDIMHEVSRSYLSQGDATNTYATQSSVKQTSENLIAKFSESGGYNLLRNSTGVQNTNQWNTWNTTSFISYVDDNIKKQTSSKKAFRIGNSSTTEKYVASPRIKIQPNKTYTISGKYYVGSNCNGAEVYWLESDTVDEEGYTTNVTFDTYITLAYDINYSSGTWKSFSKTIITSSSAKSALIRLDNNGSKTTTESFTYYSDLTVVEGTLSREWSPHPGEVFDGIIALDRDGVVVEMIEGETSKGSSKMSYEGIATYDQYGNTKSWFSDDNAYIKELNVDIINNPYLIQCKPRATNWYVGQSATGDGTGRNTSNKSNSIQSIFEYVRNTAGCYIYRQDINIICDNGVNLNEDIYIGGWIGSGAITINFGASSSYTGTIRIEECTPFVYLVGGGTWGVNAGCMWYRNGNGGQGSSLTVRNAKVHCYGFRVHSMATYAYPFLYAYHGAIVTLYGMDLVKFWAICHCFLGASVYIDTCRGDIGILAEKMQSSNLVARSSLPIFNTGKDINNFWNSTATYDGSAGNNSLWYPKNVATPPPAPTQSWNWVEKTFYFNLSSTTEGSGSTTSGWSDKWGQGKWGSWKPHRGHAVPTESISSWCNVGANTRNISMTLTMTRLNTSHGYTGEVPIPKIKQKDGTFWNSGTAFAQGATKTITLSSGVISGLSDGTLSELTMWAGTSTTDYSQYNSVSLKVTCEKYY